MKNVFESIFHVSIFSTIIFIVIFTIAWCAGSDKQEILMAKIGLISSISLLAISGIGLRISK